MKSANCISAIGRMPTTAAPMAVPMIPASARGGADGGADDPGLGQRRVHHAIGPELVDEAVGDLERAAEDADVLAHQEHALVGAHLLAHGVRDRLQVGHGGHHAAPLKPDHGPLPSSSSTGSAANRPSVTVSGSGIGDCSPRSTAASISARTSSR